MVAVARIAAFAVRGGLLSDRRGAGRSRSCRREWPLGAGSLVDHEPVHLSCEAGRRRDGWARAELVEYHLVASAPDDDAAHANLVQLVQQLELLAPRPL
jgi:hypothetical protein